MEKTQFRHVKTGKVIWATQQWVKLTQEMKQMHLWEKMDASQVEAKLKFEVPGVPKVEPAHEVVEVIEEPQITVEETPIEFQDITAEEKPKKTTKK